ncbi:MAG: serpin family protein [Aeoliella sp.]
MHRNYRLSVAVLLMFSWLTPQADSMEASPRPNASVKKLSEGNLAFAVDMYQQIALEEGNQFFSPFSISSALAMTYAGAREQTASEMQRAIHFDLGQQALHPAFAALYQQLTLSAREGGQRLNIANGLCLTRRDVSGDYKALLQESYNAEIFDGDLDAINGWVKDKTEGKIAKILEDLDPNTICVLLNAIYFKGTWAEQFKERLTKDAPFHLSASDKVMTPLMYQKEKLRLLEIDGYQAISIPYQGNQWSMVVVLPNEVDGLAAIEEALTVEELAYRLAILEQQKPQDVALHLPKFKLETDYDLTTHCQELGMKDAFAADRANFSGMGWPEGELWISQIAHKAVVEVNEEGTEAAAATAVPLAARALPRYPTFRADHPFLILIRDNQTGSILFMGRVVDPTAG